MSYHKRLRHWLKKQKARAKIRVNRLLAKIARKEMINEE